MQGERGEPTGIMPETEKEAERKRIIQRLGELSHTVPLGSTLNNARNQEVRDLEKRLLEVNPIQTNNPPGLETPERRSRQASRDAIQRVLKEVREESKDSTKE